MYFLFLFPACCLPFYKTLQDLNIKLPTIHIALHHLQYKEKKKKKVISNYSHTQTTRTPTYT